MISVHFQGKPFNITVIQVYAPTTDAKESWQKECLKNNGQEIHNIVVQETVTKIIPKKKKSKKAK